MKSNLYNCIIRQSLTSVIDERLCPIRKDRTGGIFVEYVKVHCSGNYSVKCVGLNGNGLPYIGTVTNWSKDKFVYQVMSNQEYTQFRPVLEHLSHILKTGTLIIESAKEIRSYLYR